MKKISLAIISLLSTIPFISNAQNSNPWPTTGSVGIGTVSPADVLEVAKSSTAKAKFFTPSGYTYPTDFSTGVIGLGLTRSDGLYTNALYSYRSSLSEDNLAIGSRSDIVLLAGMAGLGSQPEIMRIRNDGRVGIGTSSPQTALDVLRSGMNGAGLAAPVIFRTDAKTINDGVGIPLQALNASNAIKTYANIFSLITDPTSGTEKASLNFSSIVNGTGIVHMTLVGGNVGIGTTNPDEKLTVNGTIHSTEVKVNLSVPGPDYVFEPTYQLSSLAEIKTYVDKNHHLPEIPSAAEMAKNGLDLGDMNMKLLKKVEELTLYIIEQQKQIRALQQNQTTDKTQQNQIDELRKQLKTLLTGK